MKKFAFIMSVLALSELNQVDGKIVLSEVDVDALKAFHLDKFGAELTLEGIAFDDDGNAEFSENELASIQAALEKESPGSSTATVEETDAEKEKLRKDVKELAKKVKTLEAVQKKAQETIIKLGQSAEPDLTPEEIAGNMKGIVHSKTHLFASHDPWDAFESRPWNQRAAGKIQATTDYTPIDISQINTDFGAYYRENKTEFLSFLRAKKRLPEFWNTVSNVQDQIAYAKAFTGEVTQARKKKWLPKGEFEFQPEIAKVYPVQIDVEFKGYELQSLETSWMSHLATIKNSGSTAYKMSFIAYLAQEILKKAAEEDEISQMRGVYIATGDSATVPGLAIHKMNGLYKNIIDAQKRFVYKPFSIGTPTEENIVDYVETFVNSVPEYWRDMPNMVFYMSNYWVDRYIKRRETLKGLMPTYEPGKLTVDRHENIKVYGLPFANESKFMFMTTNDNISLLENIPSEKTFLEFEREKRDIACFADYKIGIHVWAFGYEYDDADSMTYDKQIFFSNDMYILEDLFIPVAPNDTTPSVEAHTSIQTGVNTAATAITTIDDAATGDYIWIKGNTGANPSTIADAGHFDLSGAVTLDENTLILLYKRGTNDFVEIDRWDLKLNNIVTLPAGATTANADDGNYFVTSANAGATAITDITNAIAGDIYKLEGGSNTNSTTIAASGNFSRISAAMTLALGHWIKVKYNGLKFVELERYTG